MKPLRVASVGAGYFAQFHFAAWQRLANEGLVSHVGLAEPDVLRRNAALHSFNIPAGFASLGEMLQSVEIDVLDIATPPDTHALLVQPAVARGITCICQKPLAPTCEEAIEIVELAEQAGVPLVVHENFRWMPWFQQMKKWKDSGALGIPHSVSVRLRPGDGQGPRAYLDRQPYFQQMPRLLVHETLVHYVDAYRFLMGEIASVNAQLRRINPVIAGEDAGYVSFRFKDGATAMIDASRSNDHVAANPRLTMGEQWLEGSAGVMRLDGDGRLYWKPHHSAEREHTYDWANRDFGGDCVYQQQRHIVQAIACGLEPANTGRAYLRNIEIEEAIYRSNREARAIEV